MIECVLWDFGDTLADESWMIKAPAELPVWPDIYKRHIWDGSLGINWNLGRVGSDRVASDLAGLLSADVGYITGFMKRRCADVTFFGHAMDAVNSCELVQAIVTINPDIFSQEVVPNYKLNEVFEIIVTSWEEENLDKSDLCDIAIQKLGSVSDRSRALLIDNRIENVEGWQARGGKAYHFTGDAAFAANLPDIFEVF